MRSQVLYRAAQGISLTVLLRPSQPVAALVHTFAQKQQKRNYAGLPTTVCFAQNILHSVACHHMHRCSSSILLLIDAYHICHR